MSQKRVPGIGDIAKNLRDIDRLLSDKFLEDFYVWWEEEGEKQFLAWKNQDYQKDNYPEDDLEEPQDITIAEDESKPTNNGHELLTETDTARYIGISKSFLRKARCLGTPGSPPYYKIGRAVRYNLEDLDRWLKENKKLGY